MLAADYCHLNLREPGAVDAGLFKVVSAGHELTVEGAHITAKMGLDLKRHPLVRPKRLLLNSP